MAASESGSEIQYGKLLQRALRTVVHEVLTLAERDGLPGEHHFYITLRTDHAGTEVPPFVRQRYPEEMTVVLQHQFWDLVVDAEGFAVTLRFDGMPARVRAPWEAIVAFFDPTAEFGLRFDLPGLTGGTAKPAAGPRPVESVTAPPDEEDGDEVEAGDAGEAGAAGDEKDEPSSGAVASADAAGEPAEGSAKVLTFGRPREKRDAEEE